MPHWSGGHFAPTLPLQGHHWWPCWGRDPHTPQNFIPRPVDQKLITTVPFSAPFIQCNAPEEVRAFRGGRCYWPWWGRGTHQQSNEFHLSTISRSKLVIRLTSMKIIAFRPAVGLVWEGVPHQPTEFHLLMASRSKTITTAPLWHSSVLPGVYCWPYTLACCLWVLVVRWRCWGEPN